MNDFMKDYKAKPFGGAGFIINPDLSSTVIEMIKKGSSYIFDNSVQSTFLDRYREWITSTKLNKLYGLDNFKFAAQSHGTTQGFDSFYIRNHNRRFRIFKGEYMYHGATWKTNIKWSFIEDGPLLENDAVVMSMPFSNTGEVHNDAEQVLNTCDEVGIPVLLDMCYWGNNAGISFNLDRPSITDITFSLSKSFPVANLRIGVRFTREDYDDSLLIYKSTNYTNRLSAAVGVEVLNYLDIDHNYLTYRTTQEKFCKQLGVRPSKTVFFGLDENNNFDEYTRGTEVNRLSFHKYLHEGKLP